MHGNTVPLLLLARFLELWRSTQIALFSKQSVYIRFDDYKSSLITSTRGSVLRSTWLSIPFRKFGVVGRRYKVV